MHSLELCHCSFFDVRSERGPCHLDTQLSEEVFYI
jgi:hypothetical protein